ncbi:MAG TPA: hypothetical protein VK668_04555 [Mucilaginibacter sp.]|nr:hypothetical protein [Mucilaginibacter sp.]
MNFKNPARKKAFLYQSIYMKAIRIPEFGGTDVLQLEDIEVPQPGADEVLIKLAAGDFKPKPAAHSSGLAAL